MSVLRTCSLEDPNDGDTTSSDQIGNRSRSSRGDSISKDLFGEE